MRLILFTGIQATGKSSFFRERFFDTCVRINLDMLRTRHRESILFEACLAAKQPVVIDNTNLTAAERSRYIVPAKERGFSVSGYYFRSSAFEALKRNAMREGRSRVPDRGVRGASGRLELPRSIEGFDELSYVYIGEQGFVVEPWREE